MIMAVVISNRTTSGNYRWWLLVAWCQRWKRTTGWTIMAWYCTCECVCVHRRPPRWIRMISSWSLICCTCNYKRIHFIRMKFCVVSQRQHMRRDQISTGLGTYDHACMHGRMIKSHLACSLKRACSWPGVDPAKGDFTVFVQNSQLLTAPGTGKCVRLSLASG